MRKTIKEAMKENEEIKAAFKDLVDCHTVSDLRKLKAQLPAYVFYSQAFKDAAIQRFNEIEDEIMEDVAQNDGK